MQRDLRRLISNSKSKHKSENSVLLRSPHRSDRLQGIELQDDMCLFEVSGGIDRRYRLESSGDV
jgi:hypothetical protein